MRFDISGLLAVLAVFYATLETEVPSESGAHVRSAARTTQLFPGSLMSQSYCHRCATDRRLLGTGNTSDLTGTNYKTKKFLKHTVPVNSARTIGVFNDPTLQAYEQFVISSNASGSVEVDKSGRTNLVWYAGREVGFSWVDGRAKVPNDAVKLVLAHDHEKIHIFSISSADYAGRTCDVCGCRLLE